MDELLEKSIELYTNGMAGPNVVKQTGITLTRLYNHLKKRGLSRSNTQNSRKYTLNHDFFKTIDNEEKAYWFGFLYADGYITQYKKSENSKYIGVALNEKDINQLEKLKKVLEATYPINHYTTTSYGVLVNYVRLLITSKTMFHDLQTKGMVERKSLILKFPKSEIVQKHLIHHFIRVYFDGDGSFSRSKKHTAAYTFKLCGTKQFLKEVGNQIGFPNRKLSKRHKNKKNNWCLEIGGRQQVMQIGQYMYKNATVCLERKYKRYMELVNYERKPVKNSKLWEEALKPFDFNSTEKFKGNLKIPSTCQSWRLKDDYHW